MRVNYYFKLFATYAHRVSRILLFSGIHRYARGPPRRLRVPYVYPSPGGVPRHIYAWRVLKIDIKIHNSQKKNYFRGGGGTKKAQTREFTNTDFLSPPPGKILYPRLVRFITNGRMKGLIKSLIFETFEIRVSSIQSHSTTISKCQGKPQKKNSFLSGLATSFYNGVMLMYPFYSCVYIHCEAIRSEQFETDIFHKFIIFEQHMAKINFW